eukprot:713549-Pyramimonas_sp.AAC.1
MLRRKIRARKRRCGVLPSPRPSAAQWQQFLARPGAEGGFLAAPALVRIPERDELVPHPVDRALHNGQIQANGVHATGVSDGPIHASL